VSEKEHRLDPYVIREHTAHRLVVEAGGRPLIAVGVMWGIFIPVAVLIAPWRDRVRLLIAVVAAVLLAGVTLLLLRFLPTRRRVLVDCEAGEIRIEQEHLFPRRAHVVRVPLEAVLAVRRRRQVWQDGPTATQTEWVVELVGEGEQIWTMAMGEEEGPMAELARLVAEVGTRPLEEP